MPLETTNKNKVFNWKPTYDLSLIQKNKLAKHPELFSDPNTNQTLNAIKQPTKNWSDFIDFVPYKGFTDDEHSYLLLNDSRYKYAELLFVEGKGLFTLTDDQADRLVTSAGKFFRSFTEDVKIVIDQFPVNTKSQQQEWLNTYHRHLDNAKKYDEKSRNHQQSLTLAKLAMDQYEELARAENTMTQRSYVLFVYGYSIENLQDNISSLIQYGKSGASPINTKELTRDEKYNFIERLNNPLTNLPVTKAPENTKTGRLNRKLKKYQRHGYDLKMIEATQPKGGMSFKSNRMYLKDAIVQPLYVLEAPKSNIARFWLQSLAQFKDVRVVVDVSTQKSAEAVDAMNKSLREVTTRDDNKVDQAIDTEREKRNLLRTLVAVKDSNEVVKRVYVRLYVTGTDDKQLDKRVKEIVDQLTEFKFVPLINNIQSEYQSIFVPASEQMDLPARATGLNFTADSLGYGYPFNEQKWNDPYGSLIGKSFTGGLMLFNQYFRNDKRILPFSFVLGDAGFGKSTLLKKLIKDSFSRNSFVRSFDVTSVQEQQALFKASNGTIVKLNGNTESGGYTINILEVWPTVTLDTEGHKPDPIGSFANHRLKIQTIYSYINSKLDNSSLNTDLINLDNMLIDFYIDQGMWVENPKRDYDKIHLFDNDHTQYPLLHEFVIYAHTIQKTLTDTSVYRRDSVDRIYNTFKTMVDGYGAMFNQHTTLPDLSNDKLVLFDVYGIPKGGYFQALVYSALDIVQTEIIQHGRKYYEMRKNKQIDLRDVPFTHLFLDEGQNYLQANQPKTVEFLAQMGQEMRKNYAALTLAAPTIKDMFDGDSKDPDYQKNVDKLMGLFTNRIFMHLPTEDVERVAKTMGGSLTENELQFIPQLERKQALFVIGNQGNIMTNIYASKEELKLFGGGD